MLSICIPIYQHEVYNLVKELNKQCELASIPYEILCIDDDSDHLFKKKNSKIEELKKVRYIELQQNIGRSRIRNLFIEKATFNSLLFLDCDCSIPGKDFIKKYCENIDNNITYGGRKHFEIKPSDNAIILRWKYGREREDLSYNERLKSPFISFRSNNFMIKKEVFSIVAFDESITKYGHEDTLFALQLKKENFNITHIENYVIHEGLENNVEFINKTKVAVENLNELIKIKKLKPNEVKLFKTYRFLEKTKLTFIMRMFTSFFLRVCFKKLQLKNPKIFWLDVFKLFYLIKVRENV